MRCMTMKIKILTLFPDMFLPVLGASITGRAIERGILSVEPINIRDYTLNKHKRCDDYPFGGGAGLVMTPQPLFDCIRAAKEDFPAKVIFMSPKGATLTQEKAKELAKEENLIFLCGHYEGIDQRVIDTLVDEEISIGDYVLTGGELPAMVMVDTLIRFIPGVVGASDVHLEESFEGGLLEYPQYTRPEVWEGRRVPDILLSGDHAAVEEWRRRKSLERTMDKRPELFARLELTDERDRRLLSAIGRERRLNKPVEFRPAVPEDTEAIMLIVRQARNSLKRHRVDQWQGDYPTAEAFLSSIECGECFVATHGGRVAAVYCMSHAPEPDYDTLTDGKWSCPDNYCTVHRAAVCAELRGSGLSDMLFEHAERLARDMGACAIRADTHRKNEGMKKLLRRRGFTYKGNVILTCEPGHDQARQAFEKVLRVES